MRKQQIYQPSVKNTSLRQGEILTNVVQYRPTINASSQLSEDISFDVIVHPYAIVITQDCDLDWDYRARQEARGQSSKLLNSVILCEIDTAKGVRAIADKGLMNSKEWNLVENHRHERFYFFEKIPVECELEQVGLPELTADFKKIFGIDSANLYHQINLDNAKRRALLTSPYLEHFSRRYYSFHGRVALPAQYESDRGV
jgi:hypothetical protein